jgi:hypothetical protein
MAKNPFGSDDTKGSIDGGTEPRIEEKINPSGPTTGTEGWGNAPDEADVPGANPTSKRPGKEGGGNLREPEEKKRAS